MTGIANNALGLYISIPFCRSKCTYCNFASGVYPASEHPLYVDRLIEDLRGAGDWTEQAGADLPRRVETVYLGGGTPSLLAPEQFARLFTAIRTEFDLDTNAEITVECAPGQIADEALEALAAAGVNRISLGVQTFIDREAARSGRLHNRAMVHTDLRRLRAAGITNINIDLIAGLAGQTFASWEESLTVLADSGIPHASIYMLEVDQDSRLGREMLAHGLRYHAESVPTDDAIAQMYSTALTRLERAGFLQYEISNFCRAGMESRHNLRYWQRRPYLGVGLDASSMLALQTTEPASAGFVLRATTSNDLKDYLAGNEMVESNSIAPSERHEEAWFLGLRLNVGVDLAALQAEFGSVLTAPALQIVERLRNEGMVVFDDQSVRLTARGQLLSNEVFQQFLGLAAEEKVAAQLQ
jgi:oxygen-independent coproporphyrinogen-3 oxidase